jgi:hypothetical protein
MTARAPVAATERATTIAQVLSGLRYPAEKWQVVTQAEIYGADSRCADVTRYLTSDGDPQSG